MKQVKARSKSCKRLPKLLCEFSKEVQKNSSTPLGVTILEKLTTLEELLKKKDDRPLNFKEACIYLGYSSSYLYKLTYQNVIPHYKPTGKMIFFSKNEVDEWIFKSNSKLRIENSELKDDGSAVRQSSLQAPITTKDPNQMEIFNKSKDHAEEALGNSKKAIETEVVIEFPLKSRRKTLRQAQGDKE